MPRTLGNCLTPKEINAKGLVSHITERYRNEDGNRIAKKGQKPIGEEWEGLKD